MTESTPPDARELNRQARARLKAGDATGAFRLLRASIRRDAEFWQSHMDMGDLLWRAGHREAAVVAYARATRIDPDRPRGWIRLGGALRDSGRLTEAEVALRSGLTRMPEQPGMLFALGTVHRDGNRPREAIDCYRRTIERGDGRNDAANVVAEAHWWTAVALLQTGDYRAAWPWYEERLKLSRLPIPAKVGERWTGQDLDGKRLLLAWEQRYGDVIQFIRFAPLLKARGATVVVECPHELGVLLRHAEGVAETVAVGRSAESGCNLYAPVTSVPAVLDMAREDIPVTVPYIDLSNAVGPTLPRAKGNRPRVGIVWAGKPNPDRSIPLPLLAPLLEHSRVDFYSFQTGGQRKELTAHRLGWLIHDATRMFRDFLGSGQLLRQMDLVITIDSAPAHLAGALGRPTWLLLRFFSDWRWGLDGDRTLWYPTMRLFRQHLPERWEHAAGELKSAFDQWVAVELASRGDGTVGPALN